MLEADHPIRQANYYPWDSICHRSLLPKCISNTPTGFTEYLSKIRSWVETCDDNHPTCFDFSSGGHPNLPTRVLDVRPVSNGMDPCLHVSNGEQAPFMCLSYCWGGSLPIRTTRETITSFRKGISWNELPQTFQDAVSVAHFLGISFLWIDSLCIIQDDAQDWESEAAQMANIYGRSTLTIAATQSSNPNSGLFQILPDSLDRAIPSSILPPNSPPLYYRSTISHEELQNCMDDQVSTEQNPAFPLLRRAWAYQEHLLSPRIVHFTTRELVWECSHTMSCCCTPANTIGPGLQKQVSSLLGNQAGNSALTSEQDLFTLWCRIVTCYTTKSLTKESDRLIALSGIAKKAQIKLNSEYLAGLWEKDLARGLTWNSCLTTNCPRVPTARIPLQYRAPSWSWASVEGKVEWTLQSQPNGIHIIHSHCNVGHLDTTGGVHGGYIHLSGYVVQVYYHYGYPWLNESPYALSARTSRYGGQAVSFIPDTRIDIAGPDYIEDGSKLHCLILHGILGLHHMERVTATESIYFMVLRSTKSSKHNDCPVFSRVGMGCSRVSDFPIWTGFFSSATKKEIVII